MNNDKPVPPPPRRRKLKTAWKEGTAFLLLPGQPARVLNSDPPGADTTFLPSRRELPRHDLR